MRNRILFLSQCLPYPPDSGVARRTYNVLLQLEKDFDVHAACYSRRNHQGDRAAQEEAADRLRDSVTSVHDPVALRGDWNRGRIIRDLLLSYVTGKPYVQFQYASKEFEQQINQTLRRFSPELIHLDSMDLYRWLPALRGRDVPIACTHHDIESRLLRRRAESSGSAIHRAVLERQARLYEEIERTVSPVMDVNWVVSDVDREYLQRLAPGARIETAPNGVDIEYFERRGSERPLVDRDHEVLFMGPTYMYANQDAVRFFVENVWSSVLGEVPGAKFVLIGKTPDEFQKWLGRFPGVEVRGYVDDVRPHIEAASCFVVPIRVGGGTRLKILEAWAMGSPVVSTPVGSEGLETVHGQNILLAEEPAEFAESVVATLQSAELRQQLGEGGRETAENTYSWDRIGRKIRGVYASLA